MTAYNVVRFRVKPGEEVAFEASQRRLAREALPGFRKGTVIKTGDRDYCFIGEWDGFDSIVAARPRLIANLDTFRHLLEDLGSDLGVTDPVSGPVVVEVTSSRFPE
jgi:hypothetical protein